MSRISNIEQIYRYYDKVLESNWDISYLILNVKKKHKIIYLIIKLDIFLFKCLLFKH